MPALLVLDAEVELVSTGGARRLPLAQFITGNRRTQKRADEILTAVLVPRQLENAASAFLKLGARKYLVISISMVAVILETNDSGYVSQARVAVGSCSAVARRLSDLERDLVGQPADPQIGARWGLSISRLYRPSTTSAQRPSTGGRPPLRWSGERCKLAWGEPDVATQTPTSPVESQHISFSVNGRSVDVSVTGSRRLSRVLRDDLGLTGTKVGCDAGDCGACTVLLDGEPAVRLPGRGGSGGGMRSHNRGRPGEPVAHSQSSAKVFSLSTARRNAAPALPGMLVVGHGAAERKSSPPEQEVMDAIGGVLCRCTGYRKIIRAIQEVNAQPASSFRLKPARAVGPRLIRLDGQKKVDGTEIFGADESSRPLLTVRVVRCPYHRARFRFGDLQKFVAAHPGIAHDLTAQDVPGNDCYGVIPRFADQPVFAHDEARYRGEAVAAIVGETEACGGA